MSPVRLPLSLVVTLSRRPHHRSCPCSHAYRRTACARCFLLLLRCAHPRPLIRTVGFLPGGNGLRVAINRITVRRLPAVPIILIWFQGHSRLIGPNRYLSHFFQMCRCTTLVVTYPFYNPLHSDQAVPFGPLNRPVR